MATMVNASISTFSISRWRFSDSGSSPLWAPKKILNPQVIKMLAMLHNVNGSLPAILINSAWESVWSQQIGCFVFTENRVRAGRCKVVPRGPRVVDLKCVGFNLARSDTEVKDKSRHCFPPPGDRQDPEETSREKNDDDDDTGILRKFSLEPQPPTNSIWKPISTLKQKTKKKKKRSMG